MATFVLVHGAFQGAWVYTRLAKALRALGHNVYTPTLTGLGARSHLLSQSIDLDLHVQDVVNVILYEDLEEVILCGHSYGGMVITGVANTLPERIKSLVYIDAYVPFEGQSLSDIQGAGAEESYTNLARENGGFVPPLASSAFNVNASDAGRVDSLSGSQPLATLTQGVSGGVDAPALAGIALSFIFAAANGGDWFEATHRRLRDHPDWQVDEIDSGHNIMLDRTEELAALLDARSHGS